FVLLKLILKKKWNYDSSIVGAELSFFGSCFLLKNDAYMKYRLEPLAGRDGGLRARNADPLG
ncbi:MAG: hypothetical protein OIF58_05615, partial [Cohaesibacter sp.]|nr:hypothetical protein [Cohaesibacter sp.]